MVFGALMTFDNESKSFWPQISLDLKLWVYILSLFQCYRLLFIALFSTQIASSTSYFEIIQSVLQGLRFDSIWASSFVFVTLITCSLPTLCLPQRFLIYIPKWRSLWFGILTIATVSICVINYVYYKEYNDTFNEILFGLLFDDTQAIFKTLIFEYHFIEYIILISLLSFALLKFFGNWFAKPFLPNTLTLTYPKFCSLALIILLVAGFRGGLGPRPMQYRDAGVTTDTFLNKTILPPFASLRYAIKKHNTINSADGIKEWLGNQSIQTAAEIYFKKPPQKNLDDYMKRVSQGSVVSEGVRPRHIFLIVMESYDAWPLLPQYNHLEIAKELKALAAEGIYFKAFVSAGELTMPSLAPIITGLPDAKIASNYQPSSKHPFPTALASNFKKLGYKTQLFYGGFLTWERIEDFAKNQDFDVVYGAPHIANWLSTNEWGIDDASLFDFISTTIAKDNNNNTPTFNLIMSTSNHPPFSIDLKKMGFDEEKMKQILKNYPNGRATAKTLGHFWYADKVLGQFVRKISKDIPKSLFAITGDHPSRRHVLLNMPSYDASAVPLVLYGPDILSNKKISTNNVAGGHLDIAPTLLELAAPKGFSYHSMGRNLLADHDSTETAFMSPLIGFGNERIILPNCQVLSLSGKETVGSPEYSEQLRAYYRAATAIAWWRIKKGPDFGGQVFFQDRFFKTYPEKRLDPQRDPFQIPAEIKKVAGIVKTHAQTILLAIPQRTADKVCMEPTPTIEPVIVCVVETGIPK